MHQKNKRDKKLMSLHSPERRTVFLLVFLSLLVPIALGSRLSPAPMETADSAFNLIEELSQTKDNAVLVAIDFGPGTAAENKAQAKLVIEHLLRRRIPFAVTSMYVLAAPFLQELPREVVKELEEENPEESWEYGKDWVNLGYLPGGYIAIQSVAKSKDWWLHFKTGGEGNILSELPIMKSIRSINDINSLIQITGLTGTFSSWLQFFQTDEHVPTMLHGCTSITIPESYMFYVSGQMKGLFEGIAGAAWYEKRLDSAFDKRKIETAHAINTGTSYAQLLVILLVVIGNFSLVRSWVKKK